jgi:hypothetical protein
MIDHWSINVCLYIEIVDGSVAGEASSHVRCELTRGISLMTKDMH